MHLKRPRCSTRLLPVKRLLIWMCVTDGRHRHCGAILHGTKGVTSLHHVMEIQFHSDENDNKTQEFRHATRLLKGVWIHFTPGSLHRCSSSSSLSIASLSQASILFQRRNAIFPKSYQLLPFSLSLSAFLFSIFFFFLRAKAATAFSAF